jgi:TolB-like protein/DNA-binding winged helix-turn-helix (wHTH) protein/Tfp pilus assembly protein PilF
VQEAAKSAVILVSFDAGDLGMPSTPNRLFEFEGFTLDLFQGCLRFRDQAVDLRPKSFDVLRHLLENAGRLISKDELVKAIWPGIYVEEDALTHCVSEVRRAIGDSERRIIKTVPRRGYLFVAPVSLRASESGSIASSVIAPVDPRSLEKAPSHVAPASGLGTEARPIDSKPMLALPDKPSIVVLPLANISDDGQQEYFSDGVTEEIITALSRFRSLFVIARNSTFAYKGRAVDVRTIARDLGVRYVLEGSVRKAGGRVRITGQLIHAETGVHIWADRYDGDLADIFDLQDKVASDVVGAIAPKVERAEIERAGRKPTGSLDAYDTYLRGMSKFYLWTLEATPEAKALFHRAIELDPGFAVAHAMAAHMHSHSRAWGVSLSQAQVAEAASLARRAVELAPDDALVLSVAAWALAFCAGDLRAGVDLIERAVLFNPNLAVARFVSGWVNVWLGNPETAIADLSQGMRLSPIDPAAGPSMIGIAHAHFAAERYDDALAWAQKAINEHRSPPSLRIAAASAALAGRRDDAKKYITMMLQMDPTRRISNVEKTLGPYRWPKDLARYKKALSLAGLPN